MLPRIISLSGRKHSGKTHLAKLCHQYDYQIVNFADALKNMICHCLGITREHLDANKETPFEPAFILKNCIKYISNETDISNILVDVTINKEYTSYRQVLQVVGTDLIRKYNPSWHINKLEYLITTNPSVRFCVADTRFKDEKHMLDNLGADMWFIIRPNCLDISNHISETSLEWHHFGDKIIVNDSTVDAFEMKWTNYLDMFECDAYIKRYYNLQISNNIQLRVVITLLLANKINKKIIISNLGINDYQFEWICHKLAIPMDLYNYKYKMLFTDGLGAINTVDLLILKTFKNPFIKENLKKYLA